VYGKKIELQKRNKENLMDRRATPAPNVVVSAEIEKRPAVPVIWNSTLIPHTFVLKQEK